MPSGPQRQPTGALRRILERDEHRTAFDALVRLPGADLTSFLLGVAAERAAAVEDSGLMRQRSSDRFVAPASVDALQIARVELRALEVAAERFEAVMLAPVAPFGLHAALGGTPQNNVVSTMRSSEVTADPTNSLALEAAGRRRDLMRLNPRSTERVRMAAAHRVLRAQHFEGPRSFAHFSQLGLVTAGRDQGGFGFEAEALVEHARMCAAIVQAVAHCPIEIKLSAFDERVGGTCEAICEQQSESAVRWRVDPDRTHGRGYYRTMCFKLYADVEDGLVEVGDGGDVRWTSALLQNQKERLMIGGLGLERLAMVAPVPSPAEVKPSG